MRNLFDGIPASIRLSRVVAIRTVIVLAVSLGACAPTWERESGARDRNDLPLNVYNLRGNVWVSEDYNYYPINQVMYLDRDDGVVFFDASWTYKGARQILWKAAANSRGPFQAIVLTGFPLHRTAGLDPFSAHGMDVIMQRQSPYYVHRYWDFMQAEMLANFSSWRKLDAVKPDVLFNHSFSMMDDRIFVYHFGGAHSPDSVVVHFPGERILYAGSTLADPLVFLEYAEWNTYEHVLDEIEKLHFDTIVAGHGRAVHGRELIDRVREQVQAHRGNGDP